MKNENLLKNSNESSIEEISTFRIFSTIFTSRSFAIFTLDIDFFVTFTFVFSTFVFSSRSEFVSRTISKISNFINRTRNKRAKVDVDIFAMQNMIASINKWVENKLIIENELKKIKRQLTTMQKKTNKMRREQQLQINQFQEQNIKLDNIFETMRALKENYIDE